MLIIENGSCPSGSNSYADVTAADAWLGARGSGGWPPTPEVGEDPNFAAKEAALIRAADYLNGLNWRGKPVDGERIMAWPRVGVVTVHGHPIPEDAVPAQVVAANCYLAGLILDGTDLQPILERGGRIQSEGIGSMRTTYFDNASARDTVSGLVDLVGGLLAPSDSGGKIVVLQTIRA